MRQDRFSGGNTVPPTVLLGVTVRTFQRATMTCSHLPRFKRSHPGHVGGCYGIPEPWLDHCAMLR